MKTSRFVCAAALAAACATASAETISDPTRPPLDWGADNAGPEAARRPPVLQSILITARGRSAIIDGERVDLRGRFRDAEVVQITENEVVLRSPSGTEILKLYPGVEKTVKRNDAPRRVQQKVMTPRTR